MFIGINNLYSLLQQIFVLKYNLFQVSQLLNNKLWGIKEDVTKLKISGNRKTELNDALTHSGKNSPEMSAN